MTFFFSIMSTFLNRATSRFACIQNIIANFKAILRMCDWSAVTASSTPCFFTPVHCNLTEIPFLSELSSSEQVAHFLLTAVRRFRLKVNRFQFQRLFSVFRDRCNQFREILQHLQCFLQSTSLNHLQPH